MTTKRSPSSFYELMLEIERNKTKSRLKATFRRKKKPAKVSIPDHDVPLDITKQR